MIEVKNPSLCIKIRPILFFMITWTGILFASSTLLRDAVVICFVETAMTELFSCPNSHIPVGKMELSLISSADASFTVNRIVPAKKILTTSAELKVRSRFIFGLNTQ